MPTIYGKGLGLRQEFLNTLIDYEKKPVDFLEVAPENWIKAGGKRQYIFEKYILEYPMVLHGLSLSIGGMNKLNIPFIKDIKAFMRKNNIEIYSEHLSYCSDNQGYLYDLLPIPFTEESIKYIVQRIKQVQDIIEQPLVLENASYYATPNQQISEINFVNAILDESGCKLLLDVNNVYVNSVNHSYDPYKFIDQIPANKIEYIHIAGHYQRESNLIIDTHGADVKVDVFDLLFHTYQKHGVKPTLLERDFNIPPLLELLRETDNIGHLQKEAKKVM